MTLPHSCPECGEQADIGVNITVFCWEDRSPRDLIFDFVCLRCYHQWTVTTQDFKIDESP